MLLAVLVAGCGSRKQINEPSDTASNTVTSIPSQSAAAPIMTEPSATSRPGTTELQLFADKYLKESVEISYPQLKNLTDKAMQDSLNKLIKNQALSILMEYEGLESEVNLQIGYVPLRNTERILSIQYRGVGYLENAAYPDNHLYTTNLDLKTGTLLKLKDFVVVDKDFIAEFKKGTYKPYDPELSIEQEVREVLAEYSDSDLISLFAKADVAGSDNEANIFSYLTEDSLGISIGVPHALGDHAEFEIRNPKLILDGEV